MGSAIVKALQKQGVTVMGVDARECDADYVPSGDLMDAAFCDALPERAVQIMGGLNILVNNAGIITRGKITETTDEDYSRTMAINVGAPFRLCRAAIPIMAKAGHGAIVNIASCWGVHPGQTIRSM